MRWRKLGRLYAAPPIHPKLQSHAANPLAVHLRDDIFRVFFSGRDEANRSSVGFVDVDIVRRECLATCVVPAFVHGPAESFYSHGVSIGCCYEAAGTRYMLFMGWHLPGTGHWYGQIGRLVVGSDLALRADSDAPLLALDTADPISLSYPWVVPGDKGWRMWYGSTLSWDTGDGSMLHVIKEATSANGTNWTRGELAVPYQMGVAQAFSRPTVAQRADGGWDMWFSYRDDIRTKYRIGRATSDDGRGWALRLANVGIGVSEEGWDSEMVEYPFVFDHRGERYMLYCGNGYGQTGFGLAMLENEA
jgi:hypothetical protein